MKGPLHNLIRLSHLTVYKLLFAGITVALALGNWAVIAWLQNQRQLTDSRIADSQSLLGRTREVHAHYRHWQAQTKLARQTAENLAAKMPASPQESQFLHELSQMAATNQVTLSDFRRGNIADLKEFKEIELRVRGTGTYAGLCRWLTGLEGLPRNVRVSQMTLAAPATVGGNCSVELDLHLRYGLSRTPDSTVSIKRASRSPVMVPSPPERTEDDAHREFALAQGLGGRG